MPKIWTGLLLALYASAACADGYLDGNRLYERYEARQMMIGGSGQSLDSDAIDAGFYIGYVQGSVESMSLCIPDKLAATRAEEIVGTYLKSHPKELDRPASLLVKKALDEAYPCRR
jgi:hypothetical protein